jgi:hypothetical protein
MQRGDSSRGAWEQWRRRYVTGDDDVTLDLLAQEPGSPSLSGLKKVSARESWPEQRRQYRNQVDLRTAQKASVRKAADYVERLVDIAEVQTRHIQLAKSMQARVARTLQEMQKEDVRLSARDAVTWLKVATELERLAVGLVTTRSEVTAIDVATLTDDELQAIIKGAGA